MVDVDGDDRAAPRNFAADEFGRDDVGDLCAEAFAVADVIGGEFAAQILALGDVFHFGGDNAAAGVVHLGDVRARLRAQRAFHRVGELRDAARAIGAELAVVLRLRFAAGIVLHVAARHDPVAALGREPGIDVDSGVGIGVGTGRVVDPHRRLAPFELDLAHGDLHPRPGARADIDLAATPDRPGGNADFDAPPSGGHFPDVS